MPGCARCGAEIGLYDYCAVCGAPAPTPLREAPPEALRPPTVRRLEYPTAPLWRRVAAGAIDLMLIGVYEVLVGFPMLLLFQIGPGQSLYDGAGTGAVVRVLIALVALGLPFGYGVVAENGDGQTLGKRLLALRVVAVEEGATMTVGRSLRRSTVRVLGVVLVGAGYLAARDDPQHRAWHDRFARTVVRDETRPIVT